MSATFVRGYSFGSTELVTAAKLHALIESATVSGLTPAEMAVDDWVFYNDDIVSYDDELVYYS